MILDELRAATRPCHESLDQVMPFSQEAVSLPHYLAVLKAFYGIFQPLENQLIHRQDWLALLPDYPERRRLPFLEQDLSGLGISLDQQQSLPRLTDWEILDLSNLLGTMYVMEGSTLGGQHIARRMQQQFNWPDGEHTRFFASYGALVGPRWKTFCHTLETYAADQPDSSPIIVQSAVDCFKRLYTWFEQTLSDFNKQAYPV